MSAEKIVITGTGALCAVGDSLNATWNSLLNKKSGIRNISAFDASKLSCNIAAEIIDFDLERAGDFKQRKRLDRSAMFALAVAEEAIENSGLLSHINDSSRIGVFWASGNGGITTADAGTMNFGMSKNQNAFNPFFQSNVLIDTAASRIAQKFGLKGPNITTVSACASGNTALITAQAYMLAGWCDVALVGGSEAAISPSVVGGFSSMKVLSTRNNEPHLAGIPFSSSRDGFVIGEGAAAMILEKESFAQSRNAKAKAYFKGGVNSNDGGHITSPDNEGKGASTCISQAIQLLGLVPDDIDAVYAHGTSTILGDASEYLAYKSVFGESLKYIPIASTKGMTGHLLGASASLEAVLSVEMIYQKTILPINHNYLPDKKMLDPSLFLFEKGIEMELKHVMNHSSGFGGQHSTTIFSTI